MSLFCCRLGYLFFEVDETKPVDCGAIQGYSLQLLWKLSKIYFFAKCWRQNSPNVLGIVCNHSGFLHLINKDGGIFPLCADKCDLFAINLVSSWTL